MNFFNQMFGQFPHGGGGGHYQHTQAPPKNLYNTFLSVFPAYELERSDLEKGNKILLPASVLKIVSQYTLPYPMIFQLYNDKSKKKTFVGVLEFVAPEGCCYIPFWLFTHLGCFEGMQIQVTLISEGLEVKTQAKMNKYIKIQPHETAFIQTPDPRAILEKELRNFTAVCVGDTIQIGFMKKQYAIDILEVKPKNQYNAISLVDADVEIDFATPLDYVEEPQLPALKKKESSIVMGQEVNQQKKQEPFGGKGMRLDGKQVKDEPKPVVEEKEEYNPRKHKLKNGVRQKVEVFEFQGKGIKVGASYGLK